MWMLTHLHTGDKLYFIPEVQKYIVGRTGSNIVLKDDSSISRSHAILLYVAGSLKLEDAGSKYGTYHNENIESKTKMCKGTPIELKEGDRVLFGVLKNEWIVSKINISAMTSSLTSPQTTEIQTYMKSLGGKLILKWEPSCTHLTMSEITITIKVLHALIEKIPIVSCEYWKDYLKNVREQKAPPKVNMYLPKPSTLLSSAINFENFDFNDRRKTLFSGKTFVFMSKKHHDMYSQIINKAGGKCRDLKNNIHKSFLLQKDVIIVQYVASTQSQGSQTINTITEYLDAHSIRTIPEYEIGLAIVCCTTEKYCNPAYNTILHILPNSLDKTPNIGTILAENTRSQRSEINTSEPMVVEIDDSECLPSKPIKSKMLQSEIYEEKSSDLNLASIESSRSSRSYRIPSKMQTETYDTAQSVSVCSNTNNNDKEKPKGKKRRKSPNIEEDANIAKKVRVLQVEEKGNDSTETSNTVIRKGNDFTETSNTSNSNKILPTRSTTDKNKKTDMTKENQETAFKTKPNSKERYSGFLQKSQTNQHDRDITQNRPDVVKRGRIACITDNESDGEDDIFNFGSSAKKSKTSNYNSDEELFAFGNKEPNNIVDLGSKLSEDDLPQTQPFIAKNNLKTKSLSRIKISPLKASSEGWLSKMNMLEIKAENDPKKDIKFDADDTQKNEWIDSIKGCFEVRIRKMNLSTKENNVSKAHSSSDASLNTSKKNFKAFVKKNNYKPQTIVIRTSRR